jgi:anti-sigma regulatory factor (Ser/Thr protein kinase)
MRGDVVTIIRDAPVRLCLPPQMESSPRVREALCATLLAMRAGQEETADLLLAACEAFNNAVAHGSMASDDQLLLAIETMADELIVTLQYRGEPFPVAPPTLPDASCPHGRGRYLMELFTDRVTYEFHDHWTRAELRRRIRGG